MRLYEIPLRYQQWLDKVDSCDGEITAELSLELTEIEDDLATKADAYAAMIKRFKYEEEACREEAKRLTAKAVSAAAKRDWLKFNLMQAMKSFGVDRICGKRFSVSRIVNKIPSIRWESNQQIPFRFQKVQVVLDNDLARTALKEEGSLPEGFKVSNAEYVRIS